MVAQTRSGPHFVLQALALVLAAGFLTGGLGAPFQADEMPFEAVRRTHFDALAVQHTHDENAGAATLETPLVLRLRILGDVDDATLQTSAQWLLEHANVRLVTSSTGAPLYLTANDLSATSGRATLGATLRTGMAVEVRNPDVASCVLVHEVLHFLGLRHVDDADNIMSPHCAAGKLATSTLWPHQVDQVSRLQEIRAATPRGAELWAYR